MKICRRCREAKELTKFSLNAQRPDGYSSYCKDCYREYQQKHYINNRELYIARAMKWQEDKRNEKNK